MMSATIINDEMISAGMINIYTVQHLLGEMEQLRVCPQLQDAGSQQQHDRFSFWSFFIASPGSSIS